MKIEIGDEPKLVITKAALADTRKTMRDHYGMLLTDEQVLRFLEKGSPRTAADIADCQGAETMTREELAHDIALALVNDSWPCNGDIGTKRYKAFYTKFPKAAKKAGIRLLKGWG